MSNTNKTYSFYTRFLRQTLQKLCFQLCMCFQILVKLFWCFQKPKQNCLVTLFQSESPFGTNRNGTNTLLYGFENGLMQIRTERCPNEAISKQICHNFGRVYLGSKLPCPTCSFASPRMYHLQRSATCRAKPSSRLDKYNTFSDSELKVRRRRAQGSINIVLSAQVSSRISANEL